MKKKLGILVGLATLLFTYQEMKINTVMAADKDIKVITTFYPVYEFTKGVVGDQAEVKLLMKAGTEPHEFEPNTKDIKRMQDADVFIYMDDNMETWLPDVKKSLASDSLTYIECTDSMALLKGKEDETDHHEESHEEGHEHIEDPHVWLSPKRSIEVVTNISNALSKKYPDKKPIFDKNAEAYINKLRGLDKEYSKSLSKAKQKSFVTQHSAFAYLAKDYGLKQVAINGISSGQEPSAKRLAQLSDFVKKYDIKYIYFEENASNKVSKTLAQEAGLKVKVLNPIEGINQKDLDKGKDYFTVMKDNLKALELTTKRTGKDIKEEN